MPFTSPKRKISDTENKLRILLCLDRLGLVTQEQLWPFVARLELMEYVPFCMFVDELLMDGAIAAGSHALSGMLYLTAAGRQQLELFSSKVVHADQQRIVSAAPKYARQLSERRQVRAVYERSEGKRFRASGTVRESDVPTLIVRMSSADQALVEHAVNNFESVVSQLLTRLYTLPLVQPETAAPEAVSQEEAMADAAADQARLCAFGGPERAAVVKLSHSEAAYTLLLLLPSEDMAWAWAHAAMNTGEALAQEITGMFRSCPL